MEGSVAVRGRVRMERADSAEMRLRVVVVLTVIHALFYVFTSVFAVLMLLAYIRPIFTEKGITFYKLDEMHSTSIALSYPAD